MLGHRITVSAADSNGLHLFMFAGPVHSLLVPGPRVKSRYHRNRCWVGNTGAWPGRRVIIRQDRHGPHSQHILGPRLGSTGQEGWPSRGKARERGSRPARGEEAKECRAGMGCWRSQPEGSCRERRSRGRGAGSPGPTRKSNKDINSYSRWSSFMCQVLEVIYAIKSNIFSLTSTALEKVWPVLKTHV